MTTVRAVRKLRFVNADLAELDREREASMADEGGTSAAWIEGVPAVRSAGRERAHPAGRGHDRWLLALLVVGGAAAMGMGLALLRGALRASRGGWPRRP
jgi:hypothetical protein